MFEKIARLIPDPGPHPKVRLWFGLAITGFAAMMIFGAVSLLQPLFFQAASEGDPIPEVVATTLEGETMSLVEAARGRDEMLVVAPSCEVCTHELRERIAAIEGTPGSFPDRMEDVLMLLVRQPTMPRAGFMEALHEAGEMGAGAVRISQETARRLGVRRVPASIAIRGARMGEVRYWDKSEGGGPYPD